MATHDQVAHNWAHRTGRAHRGFNMYHDDETVWSYGSHFPIARHVTDRNGKACVLLTTRNYSISTTSHKSKVLRAIPEGVPIHYVNDVTAKGKLSQRNNYHALVKEREKLLSKASRARNLKEYWLNCSETLRRRINAYTKAFRLGFREIPYSEEIHNEIDAARAAMRRKKDKRNATLVKEWEEKRPAWEAGENIRLPHHHEILVRVKGEEVQTSWGATVPLHEALRVLRFAKECADTQRPLIPQGNQLRVGPYPLNRIDANGTIHAGCHRIPLTNALRAAKLANIEI